MFDLQLEWTVGVGDGGREKKKTKNKKKTTPPHPPLSLFLTVDRPLGTNLFLSPAFRYH